ncbi:MAG: hypothetical protein MJK15_03245 [Colwellia sp.]|nr:hypothetical protein [Colwellia sp.]
MAQVAQVISLVTASTGQPIKSERLAGVAGITPGMLVVELLGEVVLNTTANALSPKLVAQTNLANAGDIDQVYADGETVSYGAYHSGQEVNAILAAGAAAIADGAPVTSAGDGTWKVGLAANAIGYATEAVDNSGGGSAVRISIRIA